MGSKETVEQKDSDHLSRTTSVSACSLVSTRTDEHQELYDHQQHNVAVRGPPRTTEKFKNDVITPGITFQDDSDEEFSEIVGTNRTIREPAGAGTTTRTGVARPSRVAHSMSFQQQLYNSGSKDNMSASGGNSGAGAVGTIPSAVNLPSSNSNNLATPAEDTGGFSAIKARRGSKSQSILDTSLRRKKSRALSECSSSQAGNLVHFLAKTASYRSQDSGVRNARRNRRLSAGSDVSNGSRESQETEEDVCFPMQQPEHTRINGIDFDELDEFSAESIRMHMAYKSRFDNDNTIEATTTIFNDGQQKYMVSPDTSAGTSTSVSSAALKYTPKETSSPLHKTSSSTDYKMPGISFGSNKVEKDDYIALNDLASKMNESEHIQASMAPTVGPENGTDFSTPISPPNYNIPDRFAFFCSDAEETTHAPDIPSLVSPGQSFRELFRNGTDTWWLDCICPTDEEMRCIAKAFGIHPLTAEDIRMQETREKVELFKSYYFVCFHTFENDPESEDFLEPINVYMVVFRKGVLTFHFTPVSHPANVRRRVRQLRDYVDVNSDWICYALIDDITDSFAPVIQSIEYEADVIEDSVFISRDMDVAAMLQTIGEGRRKTMTLMRLLSGKADVIKMFAKRCQDEANGIGPALTSEVNIANLRYGQQTDHGKPRSGSQFLAQSLQQQMQQQRTQPRADIALYLGDIQDHVVTMFQNLLSYEKIFSRSHSNYLAQLQVESFRCNNKVTEMLGKVTMIGTMLIPLNLITGLFGMNVTVPGQDTGRLYWFFGILGFLFFLATISWFFSSWWIARANAPVTLNDATENGARSVLKFRRRNHLQITPKPSGNKSVISCPSRYARYC